MSSVSQGITPSAEIISHSLEPESRHSKLKRKHQFDPESFEDHVSKKPKRGRVHNKTGAWINQQVIITHGKYRGEVGLVKESGHGFYCVQIPGRGDIMKRGAQLQRVDDSKRHVYKASKPTMATDLTSDTDTDTETEQGKLRKAAFILVDLMRDRQSKPFAENYRHRPASVLSTKSSLRVNLDQSVKSKRDLSSSGSGSDSESNHSGLLGSEQLMSVYSSDRLSTSTSVSEDLD